MRAYFAKHVRVEKREGKTCFHGETRKIFSWSSHGLETTDVQQLHQRVLFCLYEFAGLDVC